MNMGSQLTSWQCQFSVETYFSEVLKLFVDHQNQDQTLSGRLSTSQLCGRVDSQQSWQILVGADIIISTLRQFLLYHTRHPLLSPSHLAIRKNWLCNSRATSTFFHNCSSSPNPANFDLFETPSFRRL